MAHRWHDGSSRRTFLKRAAAALTAVGVLVTTPVWMLKSSRGDAASARPGKGEAALSEPLVAYVRNAARGEVVLLVGTKEVVRRDPELASLLVRCCEV